MDTQPPILLKPVPMPCHVAVIMDGNGRWAERRGLPRVEGHRAGVDAVRACVRAARETGIEVLTLFAFSSENWSRPQEEVGMLMSLLEHYLQAELEEMLENGIRLNALGRLDKLPESSRAWLDATMKKTAVGDKMTLNLALSYSGREDLVMAARKLAARCVREGADPMAITEEDVSAALSTSGQPDPDLLIRTSGEYRLSNFLLWQLAYTEIVITDVLWPDFRKSDFLSAIAAYQGRERRFGKTGAQLRDTETASARR